MNRKEVFEKLKKDIKEFLLKERHFELKNILNIKKVKNICNLFKAKLIELKNYFCNNKVLCLCIISLFIWNIFLQYKIIENENEQFFINKETSLYIESLLGYIEDIQYNINDLYGLVGY